MKEITVVAKDRIGLLADISELLAKNGIKMESVAVETSKRTAVIRILSKHPEKAKAFLERDGFKVIDSDVLVVRVSEKPGELAQMARALADAQINIENVFLLNKEGSESLMALRIDKYEHAKKVLKKYL